jgi:hypothetical protein
MTSSTKVGDRTDLSDRVLDRIVKNWRTGDWVRLTVSLGSVPMPQNHATAIMERLTKKATWSWSERHAYVDRSLRDSHVFYLSPEAFALLGDLVKGADGVEPIAEPPLGADLQWIHP